MPSPDGTSDKMPAMSSSGALPQVRSRYWAAAGALACAAVVAGVLPSLPSGASWDNAVKLQVAMNLLDGRGPELTSRTPWDDMYVVHAPDGRRYAGYPLLASVIHFPTLWLARIFDVSTASFPSLGLLGAAAWLLVAWGRRSGVSPAAAVAGAMIACVTTALWPTAAYGYDNVAEVLGLAAILWAGAGEERRGAWLGAGLLVGGAVAIRYGGGILVVPTAAAILGQAPLRARDVVRRAIWFALGCAPGLALIVGYNLYRFGSPFTVHAVGTIDEIVVPWLSRFHLEGMAGLVLSPGKGVLWYGLPLLAAVLLSGTLARRHSAAFVTLGAYGVAAVVLFGRLRFWHGDWTYGPRYVAPLYVAVVPLGWLAWERLGRAGRLARAAAVAGFIALAALQAVAATTSPQFAVQARVLRPLAAAGKIVTRPLVAPPVPEDNGILYFRVASSPLLVASEVVGEVIAGAEGDASLLEARHMLAWAPLLPLLALAAMAAAALLGRRRAEALRPGDIG